MLYYTFTLNYKLLIRLINNEHIANSHLQSSYFSGSLKKANRTNVFIKLFADHKHTYGIKPNKISEQLSQHSVNN